MRRVVTTMEERVLAAREGLPVKRPLLCVKAEDPLVRLSLIPQLGVEAYGAARSLLQNVIHHVAFGALDEDWLGQGTLRAH